MADIRVQPLTIQIESDTKQDAVDELLSPTAQLLQAPQLINCCIVAVMGSNTILDVDVVKRGLENTLIKHPRFSSLTVMKGRDVFGEKAWQRTKVSVDDHVITPQLDHLNMDLSLSDQFVEEYVSNLTNTLMDFNKPLWEMHILNIKTSDANAVIIFRIHHSIGDGVSLMNLLLACTRKSSDPQALPTLPQSRQRLEPNKSGGIGRFISTIWTMILMLLNTFVDFMHTTATAVYLKDSTTPIKGSAGVELTPKRIVHKIFSLEDIKLMKTATNSTVNDVLVGVTEAGLSCYLNGRYESKLVDKDIEIASSERDNLPKIIRLTAALMVNVRPSAQIEDLAAMMENGASTIKLATKVGYILLPLNIGFRKNPLDYIRKAKAIIDRKKLSFECVCSYYSGQFIQKLFGVKQSASTFHGIMSNTTLTFSSIVGPQEEISMFGHQLSYIAPSVYGVPQALVIHWQSYADKMVLSLSADPNFIPDPHKLCSDIEASLQLIKNEVIQIKS